MFGGVGGGFWARAAKFWPKNCLLRCRSEAEVDMELSLREALIAWPIRGKGRGTGTSRGSQTNWSCRPETMCLLASTSEEAVRLAGLWSTGRCPGAGTDTSSSTGAESSGCHFFNIAADDDNTAGLISACEKGGKIEKARAVHELTIRACGKGHKTEKAIDLDPRRPSWADISACDMSYKAEEAMEPMQPLNLPLGGAGPHQRGLEPNVIADTTLISACEKNTQAEKAMQLGGGGQQQRGLEPIVIADTTLISACEEDEVEEAMELLPETQQRGIDPDVITYEALVSACDKDHKIDTMERFAEMQKSDRHTYTALISASEKGESVEKAMELFDEMILRTFKALFMGCEDNKVAENAMKRVVARQKYMITQSGLGMKCRKERVVAMVLFADMQKLDMEQWHCTQRWTRATR